jgi:hypothetical protein
MASPKSGPIGRILRHFGRVPVRGTRGTYFGKLHIELNVALEGQAPASHIQVCSCIFIFGYALLDLIRKLNNLASASGVKKVVLMMATASTTIQGPGIGFPVPFEQNLEGAALLL